MNDRRIRGPIFICAS